MPARSDAKLDLSESRLLNSRSKIRCRWSHSAEQMVYSPYSVSPKIKNGLRERKAFFVVVFVFPDAVIDLAPRNKNPFPRASQ